MKKYIQKRFAMSEQGAKDFLRGSFWTLLQNLSYVLPVVLLYLFLQDFGASLQSDGEKVELNVWFYVVLAILFIAIIGVVAYFQYIHTYVSVYSESAKRRIGLAEKLRKLPLSFFWRKKSFRSHGNHYGRCREFGAYIFSCRTPIVWVAIDVSVG